MLDSYVNHDNLKLLQAITTFGDVIPLRKKMDSADFHRHILKYDFVKYNPRKSIQRYGLSLTSLNGDIDGIADLDSLPEYNAENGTRYTEGSFRTFTEVWNTHNGIQELMPEISHLLFRSHILKLGPGGFFPIHRDFRGAQFDCIRLIMPLKNCTFPSSVFILDKNIIHGWDHGRLYFINTIKEHLLFNASVEDSYWIVFNVNLVESTVKFIHKNLLAR